MPYTTIKSSFLTFLLFSIAGISAADELEGKWQSACFDETFGNGFEQETLVFDNGSWESIDSVFADASCTTAISRDASSGTYHLSAKPDKNGLLAIDLTITNLSEVIHDEQRVARLNLEGDYCIGKTLKVNEPINPLECNDVDLADFSLPVTYYELMQIREDILSMSDYLTGEGDSPDTRPTGIDAEDRLTRVSR